VRWGLRTSQGPRIDRLFDPRAALPPLFRRSSVLVGIVAVVGITFLIARSPQLGMGETTQLHAMSVQLLAHRLGARALGLSETAAAVAAFVALRRRFASARN